MFKKKMLFMAPCSQVKCHFIMDAAFMPLAKTDLLIAELDLRYDMSLLQYGIMLQEGIGPCQ
jgi:hypothetical protein